MTQPIEVRLDVRIFAESDADADKVLAALRGAETERAHVLVRETYREAT